jgi:uncharacterized protein (DUF697 family)
MSRDPNDIIRSHVYWAVGAGAVPLPLIDLAAVAGIQLDMLKQLSAHFGVPYREEQGKSWLSAMSASLLARLGANALKLIPGVGTIIGGVTMAITSGASTYALGRVAVEHFEARGTFDDLDLDAAQARYAEAYEEGKAVAAKVREAKAAAEAEATAEAHPKAEAADPIGQLERLAALHDKGALTDAEFTAAKARLLG